MYDAPYPDTDALGPGRHVIDGGIHLFDREGESIRDLGAVPQSLVHVEADGSFRPVGFVPRVSWSVRGERLFVGWPLDHFDLTSIDLTTGARTLVRFPIALHPAPEDLRTTIIDGQIESARAQGVPESSIAMARQRIEGEQVVDTLAGYVLHLTSPDGHHWFWRHPDLREMSPSDYMGAWGESGGDWVIAAPDGRWLGTIELPDDLEVRWVGDDHVIGIRRDEFDLPWIERHPLIKPR